MSDEEKEIERWRPTVAREKMRKIKKTFFFNNSFLNFFNYQKKSQNDVILAHLTVVDN